MVWEAELELAQLEQECRDGFVELDWYHRCSGILLKLAAATARRIALVFLWWLLQQLASCKTLESTQEEGSTGFLFGTAYKRTLESCNAVKGHFAILHFSHLACCCYAYASLCSDRCNRQRASLLQALARPRLVSSDACNAAPSAASLARRRPALQALQPR